jgi:predicted small secreted protein
MHARFTGAAVSSALRHSLPLGGNPQEITMKRIAALLLLALFSMNFLAACNTMAGAGKDVQKVGEKVTDKAQDCNDGKC